jgi:hypothetical protein
MVAEVARAYAREYRLIVDDGFNPSAVPRPLHPYADDARVNAVIAELAERATAMADDGTLAASTLKNIWVERLDTGFCSAEIRRAGPEFTILLDSGLVVALDVGSTVLARHYVNGFDVAAVSAGARDGFGRIFTTFVAQYFLYGRVQHSPPDLSGFSVAISARIADEALLFILGHELGHAMAADRHFQGEHLWVNTDDVPDNLRRYIPEIEADAIAVQFAFGALWAGQKLGQAEVELRLFAARMGFEILQTVEQCCLTPTFARHLPANRRWNGVMEFLGGRLPDWLLNKHQQDWQTLGPLYGFGDLDSVLPPENSLGHALRDTSWIAGHTDVAFWEELEMAARQFRLPTPVLYALLGLLAAELDTGDPKSVVLQSDSELAAAVAAGAALTTTLLDSLPDWLLPSAARPSATSVSDVIEYLRRHERWPEPFCAHPDVAPPLHLAAAAIARRLRVP